MDMDTSKPQVDPWARIPSIIRLPESKGGQVIVDNSWGTMNGNDLRDHLTDF